MTPKEINAHLKSFYGLVRIAEAGPLEMREAFYLEMKDKNYGEEETCDAYQWFCDGWTSGRLALINKQIEQSKRRV